MNVQKRLDIAEQCLLDLLNVVNAAIKAGDWVIDGACDPSATINSIHTHYQRICAEAKPH